MPPNAAGPVIITPAQCRERNLPPVSIEFSLADMGVMGWVLPEGYNVYATFSSPPGGVLGGSISPLRSDDRGLSLEQLARKQFEDDRCRPFLLGAEFRD